MLSASQIMRALRTLGPDVARRVLAEVRLARVYEAERLVHAQWGPDRADEALELVASIVKLTGRAVRS
jgi:hypothetical protein